MIAPVESFLSKTNDRPPTASDLFTLVRGMGWKIQAYPDGKASLRLPDATDPVAIRIAKILRREPWRSEILELANESTLAAKPETLVTQEPNYSDRVRENPPKAPATQAA